MYIKGWWWLRGSQVTTSQMSARLSSNVISSMEPLPGPPGGGSWALVQILLVAPVEVLAGYLPLLTTGWALPGQPQTFFIFLVLRLSHVFCVYYMNFVSGPSSEHLKGNRPKGGPYMQVYVGSKLFYPAPLFPSSPFIPVLPFTRSPSGAGQSSSTPGVLS